jgi:(p)ppGpp synthase/HD superfamily hydrolase
MKKTDELSLEKTLSFATGCYADKQTFLGDPILPHCKKVARTAENIAYKLYQDMRPDYLPDSAKDSIAAIVHCAVLHDVLNVSACAFEQIAEITNVQVAAMVSAISRDFRLVETKRDMEFRGRLSQSPIGAQIVVVANILCNASSAVLALNTHGLEAIPKSKKALTQMDGDLLSIHAASKFYVLRLYTHAARNMLSDISQKIKACRNAAKIEKVVLQNTKNLRESAPDAKPQPPKKREKRYARKRTLRPDSE